MRPNSQAISLGCHALALAVGLALGTLAACDSGTSGDSPEGLRVKLYDSPAAPSPYVGVDLLYMRVLGPDLGEQGVTNLVPFTSGGGSGTINAIPFSSTNEPRQVVVEGWSSDGAGNAVQLISRGTSVAATVREDFPAQDLAVFMANVNSIVPVTDLVSRQSQSLTTGRVAHSMTETSSDEVIIAGGGLIDGANPAWWTKDGFSALLDTIEVIDTRTNTHRLSGGKLVFQRAWHTGTALNNGKVFIAGGWVSNQGTRQAAATVEVIDPRSDTPAQVLAAPMAKARVGHTATMLDPVNFTILFVGGDVDANPTYEVWNPFDGSVRGARPLTDGLLRRFHAAERFEARDPSNPTGPKRPAVLIVGGESESAPHAGALIYDITTDLMISQPGGLTKGPRTQLTATYVPSQGKIYVVGGYSTLDRTGASNAIDVYDVNAATPDTAFLTSVGGFNLAHPRGGHTATLTRGEEVVIAGGSGTGGGGEETLEIIHQFFRQEVDATTGQTVLKPFITVAFSCADPSCPVVPDLPAGRFGHRAIAMETGMVLFSGGVTGGGGSGVGHLTDLMAYNPE
ncbi:MAG: kelch repeat-containing protein [Myxococcota bacterium]